MFLVKKLIECWVFGYVMKSNFLNFVEGSCIVDSCGKADDFY